MKKGKVLATLVVLASAVLLNLGVQTARLNAAEPNVTKSSVPTEGKAMQKLGAMHPNEALAYMKSARDLLIIDVAAGRWYEKEHFKGAINIPIEELSEDEMRREFMRLEGGKNVILHCRLGMVVPEAYRRFLQARDDMLSVAYIDGAPLFKEYNEWANKSE